MLRVRDALLLAFVACTPAPERPALPRDAPPRDASPREPASPPAGRTANNDARGFANQPNYGAEANLLKEQITPRFPDPLPRDRRQACTAMFAAADQLYRDIDSDPASSEVTLAALQATRTADLAACERETSLRAATCVALRLGDRDAELPWLIDQCSRAFPEGP